MQVTIDLDVDQVNAIVLEELIDAFDHYVFDDPEMPTVFAKMIKYYSTESEWKKFCKKRGL